MGSGHVTLQLSGCVCVCSSLPRQLKPFVSTGSEHEWVENYVAVNPFEDIEGASMSTDEDLLTAELNKAGQQAESHPRGVRY